MHAHPFPADAATRAYARPEAPARTARAVEYDLLARVTGRLSAASTRQAEDHPAFVRAVNDNLRLWTALAADVGSEGNRLPSMLRARLVWLYEFTARHSLAVLEGRAGVEVLVEINTAVMRGLRGDGGTT
jgi:flagellar protein FlaF